MKVRVRSRTFPTQNVPRHPDPHAHLEMNRSTRTVGILIVDDHTIVREGLKSILTSQADFRVVAEATDAPSAMRRLTECEIDLVLLDIGLPGRSGVDLLKQIKTEYPAIPVLILSNYPEDQYAVRVIKQGAAGYLTKESAPELLAAAIRKAAEGGKYISAIVAERLFELAGGSKTTQLHETLSDREFEIFKMIAAGRSLTAIAEHFSVSVKTVSTHRTRILEKTGLLTNADITRYALEHDLIR